MIINFYLTQLSMNYIINLFFTLSLSNYRKLNNNILQNIFLLYIKNNVNMTHQLYYSFWYMYVIIIISRNYILPP